MNRYLEKIAEIVELEKEAANWAKIGDKLATGKIPKNSKVFKQPTLKDKVFKGKKQQLKERSGELSEAIHAKGDAHAATYRAEREKSYLANKSGDSATAAASQKKTGDAYGKLSKSRESGARAHLNLSTTRAERHSGKNSNRDSSIERTSREMGSRVGESVEKFQGRMKAKFGE